MSRVEVQAFQVFAIEIEVDKETRDTLHNLCTAFRQAVNHSIMWLLRNAIWITKKKYATHYTMRLTRKNLETVKKQCSALNHKYRINKKEKKIVVLRPIEQKVPKICGKINATNAIYRELRDMWPYKKQILQCASWYAYGIVRSWVGIWKHRDIRIKRTPILRRNLLWIHSQLFSVHGDKIVLKLLPRKELTLRLPRPINEVWWHEKTKYMNLKGIMIIPKGSSIRIIFQYEAHIITKEPPRNRGISIDPNLNSIDIFISPLRLWIRIDWSWLIKKIRKYQNHKSIAQSKLTKNKNKKRLRETLRKLGAKNESRLQDMINKLALFIVAAARRYNCWIYFEDTKKTGMYSKSRNKNRAIWLRPWKRLARRIEELWPWVERIDPKDTTKKCCMCGNTTEISSNIARCPNCGRVDRQLNAIINIFNKATEQYIRPREVRYKKIRIENLSRPGAGVF